MEDNIKRLVGITLVSNGLELGYPFVPCIKNMLECCDEVCVNTDVNNRDDTLAVLKSLDNGRLHIIEREWDYSVNMGKDLDVQPNHCIDFFRTKKSGPTSILYLQADEIVDPDEINLLKDSKHFDICEINAYLSRVYFWKDLQHVNTTWTMPLARLCTLDDELEVIQEGMTLKHSKKCKSIYPPHDMASIRHYSRIGDSKTIAKRLNNLDSLFHEEEEYTPLEDYEFGENNNFEPNAAGAQVVDSYVSHPPFVEDFYND